MAVLVTTPVGGTTNLIDVTRASTNTFLAALNNPNGLTQLSNLIAAASNKVRNFCKRDLVLTDYVELRDGGITPSPEIHLQYPVSSIARLAVNPQTVLTVVNTLSTNQRATVATSTTGITLFWETNGVAASPDTSAVYATYPTLSALAAQINAVGNGWSATVVPGFEEYPSADLTPIQGALSATSLSANGAQLQMFIEAPSFSGYSSFDGQTFAGTTGWYLDAPKGLVWSAAWPRGPQQIRIDYRAGYATPIPDHIQEATILVAVAIFRSGKINPTVSSQRIGSAAVTYLTKSVVVPPAAVDLLREERDLAGTHYN